MAVLDLSWAEDGADYSICGVLLAAAEPLVAVIPVLKSQEGSIVVAVPAGSVSSDALQQVRPASPLLALQEELGSGVWSALGEQVGGQTSTQAGAIALLQQRVRRDTGCNNRILLFRCNKIFK